MEIYIALSLLLATASARLIPNAGDSCATRCNDPFDPSLPCQCNWACEDNADCCHDYHYLCLGAGNSCYLRCGQDYNPSDNCHCNTLCKQYSNCCGDYDAYCAGPQPTGQPTAQPTGQPTVKPTDPQSGSCVGLCGNPVDPSLPCQCNSACQTYGDCCPDYSSECGGGGGPGVTPEELSALADDLWASDESRVKDPLKCVINKQTQVPDGNTQDQAPEPLFTYVDEASIFSRPTFAAFINLLDNYNPNYGVDEVLTPEEQAEQDDFLDTILATKVMTKTVNFLISKGYITDPADFRAKLLHAWFEFYDRSSPEDSSGFEHVFLGEYKSGSKVNGFHNWVQFYLKEKAGEVNYLGYVRDDPDTYNIGANFNWNGYAKPLGGFLYGTSVEFDFAMMATCFITSPGKLCTFNLNGHDTAIQTYTSFGTQVGSAYFRV